MDTADDFAGGPAITARLDVDTSTLRLGLTSIAFWAGLAADLTSMRRTVPVIFGVVGEG